MSIPFPPGVTPPTVEHEKIPANTVKFILDKCLHILHRTDPTVLRFIDAYLNCFSVPEASRRVGIKPHQGKNLKNRPDIHDAIGQLTDIAVEKYGYNANEVVERVKEILDFDPAVLENPDGSYKEKISDIPFEMRGAIKKFTVKNEWGIDANGIKTVIGKIISVEVWDKMKAADMLGKEKEVFKDSLEINNNIRISITGALAEANKRVEIASRDVTPELEVTDVK